jgi:PAS domain S-box-containing protein
MGANRSPAGDAYLAAIVESSDDAIIAKDLDGIIQSCNPATQRIFGYSVSELVGQPVRILIPPERQSEEDEILSRLRRGERVDHFETVRIAKDGRPVEISLTISPVRDASGAIIGASKIARDITEQKRIARALADQQEWFRITLASIGDAVIASDAHGFVRYLNGPAETLTGWTSEAASGRPLAEVFRIVNEHTRQPVESPAEKVMRSGHVVGLANHTILITRTGGECPIADSAAPIRNHAGGIVGVVLVFRDVSDERRAELAVAEQREWLETTLHSIGDAVIATDSRGRIVFMNPIAEQLTGWRSAEAQGRDCSEVFTIVNEDTRVTVVSPVTRVLAEGTIVGLANHTLLISADGTERPIEDSGAPIRRRDGSIGGVVLVFRDVSERRRIDGERRAAAAERDALLTAERAARAEAERANRVKDEFVAMVSHELRTPLNAILGWTQLMTKAATDAATLRRGLDVIARNTRLQAQLISDLLDVSRITAGKLRLEIDRVDLHAIIRDALETVQQEVEQKHLVVRTDLDDGVGPIAGDRGRLQQVVWNLLSNAAKFTPAGGTIDVRLRRVDGEAELQVRDTGVGVRTDFLPYIFDRFQQADRSITRRFGGLGLGLAIVKHLVELHGGRVRADSPGEGHGAIFTVRLPAAAFPEPSRAERRAARSDETETAVSLDGIRVLVIEDEPDTRDFLDRFLRASGAMVVTAASSAEALAAFPHARPDVLVSDIGLPESDGYDLIRRIRQLDGGAALPAIALTAYARSEDRARAFQAGYQAHVAKPVEPNELAAKIASFARLVQARHPSGDR